MRLHVTLVLSMLLSSLIPTCYGQRLKYDVLLFNKKIGETTVERQDSNGIKRYTLHSASEAKVLFVDRKSNMMADVIFDREGRLIFSQFESIKEEQKLVTKTNWDRHQQVIDIGGKISTLPSAIKYSSLQMYFSEPKLIYQVFSERLGKYFPLVKKAEGIYQAEIEGLKAIYTYRNGKLTELEMKSGFIGSVYLRLQ